MHIQTTPESTSQSKLPAKPYRVAQVAAMLDVHPVTVYRDIEAGRLKALRVGSGKGAIRILPDALAEYFAQLEIRATASLAEVA